MFKQLVKTFKNELAVARLREREEEATAKAAQLASMRRNWRRLGSDKLVVQMELIVLKQLKAYQSDFYELDIARMLSIGDVPFCWLVRNHGTDLLPMEGDERTMQQAEEWLNTLRIQFGQGLKVADNTKLFICYPKEKKIKEVKLFSDVSFKVTV